MSLAQNSLPVYQPVRFVGIDYNNKSGKFKMPEPEPEVTAYQENIDCRELYDQLRDTSVKTKFVDIRESVEFEMQGLFELPEGINAEIVYIPMSDLFYGVHFNEFEEDERVVMLCTHGIRAGRAA